jgi:hypothetical protein
VRNDALKVVAKVYKEMYMFLDQTGD